MLPENLQLHYPHGLDEQHEKLFAIYNRLKELTVDRIGGDRVADIGTLSGIQRAVGAGIIQPIGLDAPTLAACADIIRYTMEHFQWEEQVLARIDTVLEKRDYELYVAFTAHSRRHHSEHVALSQHAMVYEAQFEEHLVSALSLYVFVRHWLISHINLTDREFSYWCKVADGLPAQRPPA